MPTVSGRCTDASGAPAPGVYVYAVSATGARFGGAPGTHSRRDGRWSLELGAGAWTIRETGGKTHTVAVGDTPIELDVVAAVPAATPTRDDLARLLGRRRGLELPAAAEAAEPVGRHVLRDEFMTQAAAQAVADAAERPVDHSARDAYMAQVAAADANPISQLMQRRRSTRDES